MFYIVAKIVIAIACYVDICAIWAWLSELKPEVYIAMVSVVIAVIALWANIQAGEATRKHNRLMVKPLLRFESSHQDADEPVHRKIKNFHHYKFILSNYGVGPGVIRKFALSSDGGKNWHDSFEKYNDCLYDMMANFPYNNTNYLGDAGVVISGKKETLWEFVYDSNKPAHCRKFEEMSLLWMYIEYQSIYEDKIIPLYHRPQEQLSPPPAPTDPEIMAQIHAACFTIPRPWTVQEFINVQEKSNELCLLQLVTQSDDSPICGFVIGQKLDAEQFELLTLAITPHEQGKGRGFHLLNSFITRVKEKGGKSIFLEVAKNNTSALHLYKKAGFKRVGLRPAYYEVPNTPNIDAITMRLDITE